MIFDPAQNRVQTCLLTADELATLKAAKHGWEVCSASNRWIWEDMPHPLWHGENIYRAKPAPAPTIMVNGIAVPEPVREALADGTKYWLPIPHYDKPRGFNIWASDQEDMRLLSLGLIHLTEAAAITHARAMCAPGMREGV